MSTLREAAQQALEALESLFNWQVDPDRGKRCSDAITALHAALAQQAEPKGGGNLPPPLQAEPVQEPVAWRVYTLDGKSVCVTDNPADLTERYKALPLYTAPPRREWLGLTEKDIDAIPCTDGDGSDWDALVRFARAIEAKLKEKNNG